MNYVNLKDAWIVRMGKPVNYVTKLTIIFWTMGSANYVVWKDVWIVKITRIAKSVTKNGIIS